MKRVSVDMALCDRIVRHVDNLRGLVPPRLTNLVLAIFGRTWADMMLGNKRRELRLTEDLKFSLRCLDTVILDLLLFGDLPEEITILLYKDFSTLKTLIS